MTFMIFLNNKTIAISLLYIYLLKLLNIKKATHKSLYYYQIILFT